MTISALYTKYKCSLLLSCGADPQNVIVTSSLESSHVTVTSSRESSRVILPLYILYGSASGGVKLWDPRYRTVRAVSGIPSSLNTCDIHPYSPLLACASQHTISFYNLETDDKLNQIRYHDGFMGQKIGPTKCLSFHPYKVCVSL